MLIKAQAWASLTPPPPPEDGEPRSPLLSDGLNHSNDRGAQMKLQGPNKPLFVRRKISTIISGRVRFDLIFCLVLIKELLHYLISSNWVTRWDGDQCNSAKKAFERSLANLAHRSIFCCSGGRAASFDATAELQNGNYFRFGCPVLDWFLQTLHRLQGHKPLSKMLDMLHIPQIDAISGGNGFGLLLGFKHAAISNQFSKN